MSQPPPPSPPPPSAPVPPSSGRPQVPGKPNGLAVAALVLGIAGLLFFVFFAPSILALVFGIVALNQVNRPGNVQTGKGMAISGIVLGAAGIVLAVLVIIFGDAQYSFEING